ncbi:bacterial Ig-like domain-containing protein [Lacrimispora sp.]|uniref:bacterial Ig-like domain-containing protein n=1 Tax=Lacrimispora sp. TaxID=2719234 RepID=UPI0028AF94A7|nr:bacterial Ig-like domain-containing protein [Lacrimispora sp.]
MGIKKLARKSICLLLSTGMVATGFPGTGLLEGYAAQYTIQAGEIPTKASSIEKLPSIVNCVAEGASIQTPKEITWEINNNGSFNNAGSTVNVTGTIKENGQQEKAFILAVPEQVIYLVDSNIPSPDSSADYKRFKENGNTSTLKNTVPDQAYTAGSWGYTSVLGTDMAAKGEYTPLKDTKGKTGYYAKTGKAITYKLPLDPGTYLVSGEFAEWWALQRSVDMKITYKDKDGQTKTDLLDTAELGNGRSTDTAQGSFTITTSQEVTLSFQKSSISTQEAVLSGFTIIKTDKNLPIDSHIPVTLDGTQIDKANTFGGFGSVTCNNTSRLLMDYKALHEDKYWEMMTLLFDKEKGAGLNHVKIEMGADVNSSSGTEPATMRSPDESPNVKRGAGFVFAADAKTINPDISVEILRWGEPRWTQEGIGYEEYDKPKYEARYQWYRKTIDAVYDTYGYKITEVSPGQNERRKDYPDDFAWIKYCAKRFNEDGANGVGAFDYREIKIVAADLYRGMSTTVDYLMKDAELRDLVDVISDHYQIWMGSPDLTKLNQEYGKEVWYGESTAPMINAYYRANVDPARGGVGGSASIAAMAERFISAYAYKNSSGYTSHMTELLFQPAIGAFYEGSAYSPKQLIGAFDPWSGHYEADGGIQMVQHFMQFADSDWNYLPEACYSDGTTGDGDITVDTSTDTRLAVKDPKTDDYSVMFANNTAKERKYRIKLKNLKTYSQPYHVWETRGPDPGEAFDANWFQNVTKEAAPVDNGDGTSTIELTVKPYSVMTLTSLLDRGTVYESGQNDSGVERTVLSLPYRDNFDYEDSFVEERGGAPLFTTDIEGAFEVTKSDDTGYVLTQRINGDNRPYNWNPWGSGSDESSQTTNIPWTVMGDHRWANYTAGIDVKLDTKGNGYGDNFAVLGVREVVHSSGAPYRAKIYDNGKWEMLKYNSVKKSGKIENFDAAIWHKLQLKADENVLTMYLDGEETGSFTDTSSPVMTGRITLMSGFWNTSFDQLEVMPVEGKTAFASAKLDDTSSLITWNGNVTHNIGQGFAYYNRSFTSMPAGSSLEFEIPNGIGFDLFGNSGASLIEVTIDGKAAESAFTNAAGDRETSYWREDLENKPHTVNIKVTQGTLKVDGINLLTEPFDVEIPVRTQELTELTTYIKNYTFDPEKYPQSLLEQLENALLNAEETIDQPQDQKTVDKSRIRLRNAFLSLVPSDTVISVKDLPESISVIQNSTPELPEMVTVVNAAGEETQKEIEWIINEKEFESLWNTVTITGKIKNTTLKTSIKAVVIPYGLDWFIDSGVEHVTDSSGETGHSAFYDLVAESVPLKNQAADKRYEEGSWGYVPDGNISIKSGDSVSYGTGIYESGLFVDNFKDTDIVYKLSMDAGKYRFMVGAQAYWSETHSSAISIRYQTENGEWKTTELGTSTVSASTGNVSFTKSLEIPTSGVVEVRIKKADTKIHLLSWLAVSKEAGVEMPSAVVTSKDTLPELPETVLVAGEEKSVTWKYPNKEAFSTLWSTVTIKGVVDSLKIPVSMTVEVVPKNLVYFVDSGADSLEESPYYTMVKDAVGIENEVPDKQYEEGSWGYTDPDALGGPMGAGSGSRSKTGWWAKSGKEIVYRLPLKAGCYQFSSGFYEWWNVNRPMETYVVYQDQSGQEMTQTLGSVTISKAEETILNSKAVIELTKDQTIEFHVKKTGSSDPVISWLAVYEEKEDAPEETPYHTTGIKVTRKPDKTEYQVGQTLDQAGMEVRRYEKATPSNAVRETVMNDTQYEVEYDFSKPGKADVMVTYSEWDENGEDRTFTDSFKVTVKEEIIEEEYYTTKIQVTKKPRKTVYTVGEELDTGGLEVTEYRKASPSNAMRKNLLTEDEYDLIYDFSSAGNQNVKVIYYGLDKRGEEKRFTDLFTVRVMNVYKNEDSDDDSHDIVTPGYKNPKDDNRAEGTWVEDENGWKLIAKDGSQPVNRWAIVSWNGTDSWYFFDPKGYIIIGWFQHEGIVYYLNPNTGTNKGRMMTGWQEISGKWYYFQEKSDGKMGSMLINTVTPDGYKTGADGAWIR